MEMIWYHVKKDTGELKFTPSPFVGKVADYAYVNIHSHGIAQKLANAWRAYKANGRIEQ